MPVKRRVDKRRAELSTDQVDWLEGGSGGAWAVLATPDDLLTLWRQYGAPEIVEEYIEEHPGRRPRRWWAYDSPRAPIGTYPGRGYDDGTLPMPRVRIGGVGTECSARLAHKPWLEFGIETNWIDAQLIATYEQLGRPLNVPAVDPSNPPIFEAEATFLERHGLLLRGERERLSEADFRPVAIGVE
jgi:hypothetical protein